MIDIFMNGNLCIEKPPSAGSNWQTREIKLEVDWENLQPRNNIITMGFRDDAENVHWLYDAKIEVTRIVPSTLADTSDSPVPRPPQLQNTPTTPDTTRFGMR